MFLEIEQPQHSPTYKEAKHTSVGREGRRHPYIFIRDCCSDLRAAGWCPLTIKPTKFRWAAVRDDRRSAEVPGQVDRIHEVLALVVALRRRSATRDEHLLLFADFAAIGSDLLGSHRKHSMRA